MNVFSNALSIIPVLGTTFTENLLSYTILLAVLFAVLILLSLRGRKDRIFEGRLSRVVGGLLAAVVTITPFVAMFSSEAFARPDVFFYLQGLAAGLLALYLALGRANRALVAYVLVVSAISMTATVYLQNGFYPLSNIQDDALYKTGSIASYQQASAQGGFYYFIPIESLILVPLSMVSGINLGLPLVESVVFLTVTMLSLWLLTRRFGLEKAAPAAMLILSIPQLSFITGRTLSIPYAMLTLLLVSLLATKLASRQTVGLLGVVILVMVFAHPVGPIALIAAFLAFYGILLLTRLSRRETSMSVRPAIRFLLIITAGYWFVTYIYTLIVTKATNIYESTRSFFVILLGGNSKLISGSTIPIATAPGYSSPEFWEFAYAWAAPIAIGLALLVVWLGVQTVVTRNREGPKSGASIFSSTFGLIALSSCVAAFVLLGSSFASYALGSESGQYAIPCAYFLLLLPSAFVLHHLLDSRKVGVIIITALILSSVICVGTFSPDWAPIEHQDFGSESTIPTRNTCVQANDIGALVGQGSPTIYLDYDLAAAAAVPNYKDVRAVLTSILAGNFTFGDYSNSLFVLRSDRLADSAVDAQSQGMDVVYTSQGHIGLFSG